MKNLAILEFDFDKRLAKHRAAGAQPANAMRFRRPEHQLIDNRVVGIMIERQVHR
jgi:hypothetical protein